MKRTKRIKPNSALRDGTRPDGLPDAIHGDEPESTAKPNNVDQDAPADMAEQEKPQEPGGEPEAPQAAPTIEELQTRVAALEDNVLRAKADYRNLQRRAGIERSEAIRYANAELMKALLPVVDDFERSLAAAANDDRPASVVDGVRLVYENLMKALRDHGLSSIEAMHQPFDPTVHQAVMQRPSAEHPHQTVIEEMARGYRLQDRVIRPTKVIVSQAGEGKPAETESAEKPEREAQP